MGAQIALITRDRMHKIIQIQHDMYTSLVSIILMNI